jgi:tetratricopeptide (TPR) repeat protein
MNRCRTTNYLRLAFFILTFIVMSGESVTQGQATRGQAPEAHPEVAASAKLQGFVRDAGNHPVAGATVYLRANDTQTLIARSDPSGAYCFPEVRQGVYSLRAEMTGYVEATVGDVVIRDGESRTINLTLALEKNGRTQEPSVPPQFFDEPHFTVAGVTDTTSPGGHGSETMVRNREALAQATVSSIQQPPEISSSAAPTAPAEKSLRAAVEQQPRSFEANHQLGELLLKHGSAKDALPYLERASSLNPSDYDNAYEMACADAAIGNYARARTDLQALLIAMEKSRQEKAEPHHLLGEVDEKLGNPLEAVKEYQRAAELNASESNLFDWGSELLVHRAAEPAREVFTNGNRLFPQSVRTLAGLGGAWYALGSFEQAARRFCEASDLAPEDANLYLLMGKMQAAESTHSEAIASRLKRFIKLQPRNALANYYYAVSLWKGRKSTEDMSDWDLVTSLLQNAVRLEPKLGPGYLQLGMMYSERGDFSNAISAYQQAIDVAPRFEEAHYRLAQAYRRAGETSKAQEELKLYAQISRERVEESERQRHEVQQFVYQLRTQKPAPQPQ